MAKRGSYAKFTPGSTKIWAWSYVVRVREIKNVKISAGGSTDDPAKICTRENFPLYGTC